MVVIFCRADTDRLEKPKRKLLPPQTDETDQLTAWPVCVCRGVWCQGKTRGAKSRGRKSSANALGKKPVIWDEEGAWNEGTWR